MTAIVLQFPRTPKADTYLNELARNAIAAGERYGAAKTDAERLVALKQTQYWHALYQQTKVRRA